QISPAAKWEPVKRVGPLAGGASGPGVQRSWSQGGSLAGEACWATVEGGPRMAEGQEDGGTSGNHARPPRPTGGAARTVGGERSVSPGTPNRRFHHIGWVARS